MGGLTPGGGAIMPGAGGVPCPGGHRGGAPAMPAVAATAAAAIVSLPCGAISSWDGPPTPRTGPANPAGAGGIGTPASVPLPAALPTPRLPPAPAPASGTQAMPVIFGGWAFHRHQNQVLTTSRHQTPNPLFFTLWLLRILWPDLPEFITITEHQVHMFVKSLKGANEGSVILQDMSRSMVNVLLFPTLMVAVPQ